MQAFPSCNMVVSTTWCKKFLTHFKTSDKLIIIRFMCFVLICFGANFVNYVSEKSITEVP